MARIVSFIESATPSAAEMLPLDAIPEDVVAEVEEIYAEIKKTPGRRMRAKFDSAAELKVYMAQVIAYCAQRPNGVIRFRKSPTRNLPANVMDFRITDPLTKNEEETEEIRRLTEAAKATAAKSATPAAMPSTKRARRS